MFLQGLYAALLSCRNSHVGSTWSWYMMWSGEIFFRSLERSNFWSVWPSSGNLSNRINSPIAIYAIVFFRRLRFTQLCYFVDRDLRDRVILVGRRFKPWAKQCNIFIGPGFDSQARLPVSGQCDSWPMSLAPTNGELGWWKKNLMGGKKKREVTTVSVSFWWRGRLSLIGIFFKIRCYSPNI